MADPGDPHDVVDSSSVVALLAQRHHGRIEQRRSRPSTLVPQRARLPVRLVGGTPAWTWPQCAPGASVLAATVTEAASRWGDTTFLVAPTGWALSYRSLDRISDEVAAGLAARGVGEGDVVALVLPSVPST